MIRFSIIIPHYNIPDMLERLLDTVPYDMKDVEVIVVDDRSDKNLRKLKEVKSRFEKNGVRFYRNNKGKKGAGTCRNIGIKHATGEWLLFADSDDYFREDMYSVISGSVDENADIVFFRPLSVEEGTKKISWRHEEACRLINDFCERPDHKNEVRLRYGFVAPWSKLIKSGFLRDNNIKFDEVTSANDIMFSAKAALYAKKISVQKQTFYIVTCREGSLTDTVDDKASEIRTKENIKRALFLKQNLTQEDKDILSISGTDRILGMMYRRVPSRTILKTILLYINSGIKPIDFNKISPYVFFSIAVKSRFPWTKI